MWYSFVPTGECGADNKVFFWLGGYFQNRSMKSRVDWRPRIRSVKGRRAVHHCDDCAETAWGSMLSCGGEPLQSMVPRSVPRPASANVSSPAAAFLQVTDVRVKSPCTPSRPSTGLRASRPSSSSPATRHRGLMQYDLASARQPSVPMEIVVPTESSSEQPQHSRSESMFDASSSRKHAEETAKRLARRIAHYRAQEERVLREVWDAKARLGASLLVDTSKQRPVSARRTLLPSQPEDSTDCLARRPRTRDHLQLLSVRRLQR